MFENCLCRSVYLRKRRDKYITQNRGCVYIFCRKNAKSPSHAPLGAIFFEKISLRGLRVLGALEALEVISEFNY